MATRGYISYPFKRQHCFDGGEGETTVRFQVNSQSVDRVYACTIDSSPGIANVPSEPVHPTIDADVGTTAELYSTEALRSKVRSGDGFDATDGGNYWFSLGGVQLPSFQPCLVDWHSISKCALPQPHPRAEIVPGTFSKYRTWYSTAWLICMRLCAPNADLKNISGLDTRNQALDGVFHGYENLDPGFGYGVWVESTAELRVMQGREVSLVP
jgi:hypothetical protein